jgi:hypothetical protein
MMSSSGWTSAFSSASGDADQKIPLWEFDTDGSGVTSVTDVRSFDQISADSIEQGAGSGLDADTVDGVEASQLGGGDIANDGSVVTSSTDEIDFTTNITASDDGDGTTTVAVDDAFVSNAGDTMSGSLNMGSNTITDIADPTSAQDAATKSFTDTTYVDASGDTMSGDLDMADTHTVVNLPTPSASSDAATKAYADSVAEGLDIKDAVRVCTCDQGNIDLSSSSDPNPIDTVTLNDGDRILLIEQTDATENGIYDAVTATDPTTWVRSADADEDDEVNSGMFTLAVEGSTSGNVGFILITPDPITLGTTSLNFTRFSGIENITAGDGLSKSGSTLSITVADIAGTGLQDDGSNNLQIDSNAVAGGYSTAVTKTADYTAADREVVLADATNGNVNITLPSPSDGQLVTVKKIDSSSNAVTIVTPTSETIDGQSSITITNQFAARETVSNGTNYFII